MTTHTRTYDNDETIFAAVVDALTGAALGEDGYAINTKRNFISYDDVAALLSKRNITNKFGKCLTGNTLKQIIFRCKKDACLMERYEPDWKMFEVDRTQPDECAECGTHIASNASEFCSTSCQEVYASNRYAELMN